MSDPKTPDGKTRIVTEHQARPAPAAPDTDNIRTYIPGLATPKSVGKLVIVDGPAAGATRDIFDGTNSIGRDPDQNRIGLDIDDSYISRTGHAILTVDAARRTMTLLDGGKPNRVQVNGQPIGKEVSLKPTDKVQIGRTTVRMELG